MGRAYLTPSVPLSVNGEGGSGSGGEVGEFGVKKLLLSFAPLEKLA